MAGLSAASRQFAGRCASALSDRPPEPQGPGALRNFPHPCGFLLHWWAGCAPRGTYKCEAFLSADECFRDCVRSTTSGFIAGTVYTATDGSFSVGSLKPDRNLIVVTERNYTFQARAARRVGGGAEQVDELHPRIGRELRRRVCRDLARRFAGETDTPHGLGFIIPTAYSVSAGRRRIGGPPGARVSPPAHRSVPARISTAVPQRGPMPATQLANAKNNLCPLPRIFSAWERGG